MSEGPEDKVIGWAVCDLHKGQLVQFRMGPGSDGGVEPVVDREPLTAEADDLLRKALAR